MWATFCGARKNENCPSLHSRFWLVRACGRAQPAFYRAELCEKNSFQRGRQGGAGETPPLDSKDPGRGQTLSNGASEHLSAAHCFQCLRRHAVFRIQKTRESLGARV